MPSGKLLWANFQRRPVILLVDDQPVNIRLLNEIFRTECDVLMATSGQQALDICAAQSPDLIMLDIMMPGMDGMEVLRRLKASEATAQIPVIFVTAQDNDSDEEAGLAEGAVDFISKPIRTAIVRARAMTHLTLKYQSDLLRDMAMVDGLTGIPNRRRFDEAFLSIWQSCARNKQSLSVALIDVDFFKRYNDTYGHQAGDECLIRVAKAMKGSLNRAIDMLARYGGEEFVCLLPDTTGEGAVHVANELLESVRQLNIAHEKSDVAKWVTISIGIATVLPLFSNDPTPLLEKADAALYVAKSSGRDRVAVSQE